MSIATMTDSLGPLPQKYSLHDSRPTKVGTSPCGGRRDRGVPSRCNYSVNISITIANDSSETRSMPERGQRPPRRTGEAADGESRDSQPEGASRSAALLRGHERDWHTRGSGSLRPQSRSGLLPAVPSRRRFRAPKRDSVTEGATADCSWQGGGKEGSTLERGKTFSTTAAVIRVSPSPVLAPGRE
jgi:hypothetical protein